MISPNFNHLISSKTGGISGDCGLEEEKLSGDHQDSAFHPNSPLVDCQVSSPLQGFEGHIQHVPDDKTAKETAILLQTAVVLISSTFYWHAHKKKKKAPKNKTSSRKSDGKITAERSAVKCRAVRQAFQTFIW